MTNGSLVTYDRPPVTEVVVAVAFSPLPNWTVATAGVVWDHVYSEEFPNLEDRGAYEPPIERFGGGPGRGLSISLNETPPARLLMKSSDGSELIQLQRDWFAANWVRVKPEMEYGRWPARREAFARSYRALAEFGAERGWPPIEPRQVEVSYINHVESGETWQHHGQLHRVLRLVTRPTEAEPDEASVQATYQMAVSDGPIGRLHVRSQPVVSTADDSPAFRLELTARGRPLGEGLEGILAFADMGRERIVTTFDEITTPEMHTEWGRHKDE